jgi:hypothetical protein
MRLAMRAGSGPTWRCRGEPAGASTSDATPGELRTPILSWEFSAPRLGRPEAASSRRRRRWPAADRRAGSGRRVEPVRLQLAEVEMKARSEQDERPKHSGDDCRDDLRDSGQVGVVVVLGGDKYPEPDVCD